MACACSESTSLLSRCCWRGLRTAETVSATRSDRDRRQRQAVWPSPGTRTNASGLVVGPVPFPLGFSPVLVAILHSCALASSGHGGSTMRDRGWCRSWISSLRTHHTQLLPPRVQCFWLFSRSSCIGSRISHHAVVVLVLDASKNREHGLWPPLSATYAHITLVSNVGTGCCRTLVRVCVLILNLY
ncbi:hypothetical protein BDV95DRAFT_42707 [Massariosphaeria phaeospora]|uniref:Uncharacterized protein n=1 Tax=Massariosphaeria phaeospora TaxID=100035 RepID=A0A7C8I5T1_9PLEO|nr:hypothetical protein BDV95DRAFT_42707 [Massariosphaeria phaeospora]